MFYVYLHVRLDTNFPFYVGKGMGKRAWAKRNRGRHWDRIVNKYGYKIEIIKYFTNETDAFEYERQTIVTEHQDGYKYQIKCSHIVQFHC